MMAIVLLSAAAAPSLALKVSTLNAQGVTSQRLHPTSRWTPPLAAAAAPLLPLRLRSMCRHLLGECAQPALHALESQLRPRASFVFANARSALIAGANLSLSFYLSSNASRMYESSYTRVLSFSSVWTRDLSSEASDVCPKNRSTASQMCARSLLRRRQQPPPISCCAQPITSKNSTSYTGNTFCASVGCRYTFNVSYSLHTPSHVCTHSQVELATKIASWARFSGCAHPTRICNENHKSDDGARTRVCAHDDDVDTAEFSVAALRACATRVFFIFSKKVLAQYRDFPNIGKWEKVLILPELGKKCRSGSWQKWQCKNGKSAISNIGIFQYWVKNFSLGKIKKTCSSERASE